jgi:ABC-2 type transport system permease protein
LGTIIAIARKDLRLLCRDKVNFFFTFFFPLIYGVLFGMMFAGGGKAGDMKLGVYDEDQSPRSAALVAAITETQGLKVTPAASREAAGDLVRRGKVTASIVVPKGYAAAARNVFSGTPASLEVAVDPSRRAESGLLQGKLMELSFRQLAGSLTDSAFVTDSVGVARKGVADSTLLSPETKRSFSNFFDSVESLSARANADGASGQAGGSGLGSWTPVKIDMKEIAQNADGPKSSFHITLPQAAAWGLLGAVMAFAVSLVQERTQGTLVRLSIAPIGPLQILAGKALACFITALIVQIFLLLVFGIVFGVKPSSPGMVALAIVCASFGFSGLMATLAVLGRTEGGASGIGRAVLLLLTIFGGGAMPLIFMPGWMQSASGVSPFKWAIVALEGGVWRDYSLAEMALPCGILLGVGLAGLGLGAYLFRRLQTA